MISAIQSSSVQRSTNGISAVANYLVSPIEPPKTRPAVVPVQHPRATQYLLDLNLGEKLEAPKEKKALAVLAETMIPVTKHYNIDKDSGFRLVAVDQDEYGITRKFFIPLDIKAIPFPDLEPIVRPLNMFTDVVVNNRDALQEIRREKFTQLRNHRTILGNQVNQYRNNGYAQNGYNHRANNNATPYNQQNYGYNQANGNQQGYQYNAYGQRQQHHQQQQQQQLQHQQHQQQQHQQQQYQYQQEYYNQQFPQLQQQEYDTPAVVGVGAENVNYQYQAETNQIEQNQQNAYQPQAYNYQANYDIDTYNPNQ